MNETRVIAALYRCDGCGIWWSSQEDDFPHAHLIFQVVEPYKDLFPWEDYQGRQAGAEANVCPRCDGQIDLPRFSLTQSGELG
jgi:hypothetical protein